ncbi:MAG: DUF4252 domain-containing protein [Salinivirgaceae bacterium]|nr:DUF4252 domain-containing protein [Salinivirgaceae bacterium]
MKKIALAMLLMITSSMLIGQKITLNQLFDKYSGQDGYTTISISKQMFSIFAAMSPSDSQTDDVIKGLSGIRILVEEKKIANSEFVNDLKLLQTSNYKEMMSIKEKDTDLKFLIKMSGLTVSELLMVIIGDENVLICIEGDNIDLKTISNISKTIKIDGLENLEKMNKK